MSKPKTTDAAEALIPALNELQAAQAAYDAASAEARSASMEQTRAVNDLNAKQKEVDKLMADLRAASSGDWSNRRMLGDAVTPVEQ